MPACPVCHSNRTRIGTTRDPYTVWRCEACGLFWVPGVSDAELEAFYDQHYFQGSQEFGYANYVETEGTQRTNARRLLGVIARHSRAGPETIRMLDVGCAYGFLVDEACKAGVRAEGVDYSVDACRHARSVLGRNVMQGTLHAADFPSGQFDAVTSVGSIEHLNDPVAMVEEVARITKPGGLFLVTTLDTKAVIRIFRFKPPEHLFYFSRHNLSLLLNDNGFTVEHVEAYWANHALGEALGLLSRALLGSRINLQGLIERMPWGNVSLKLPNNEMLMVARRR
jgi:2-polyprenyl-3-methyl-5-hydroxy-6-metoxy-1,4-benzoquinol methylase